MQKKSRVQEAMEQVYSGKSATEIAADLVRGVRSKAFGSPPAVEQKEVVNPEDAKKMWEQKFALLKQSWGQEERGHK